MFGTTFFGNTYFGGSYMGHGSNVIPGFVGPVPDPFRAISERVGPDPFRATSRRVGPDPFRATSVARV